MKRSDLLFVSLAIVAFWGVILACQFLSLHHLSSPKGLCVVVGACNGVDMTPHNDFCSKPKKECKTQYVVISPWGAPVPDGCDVYEAEDACPLRWGALTGGEGGYAAVNKSCGEMQAYGYTLCDDNAVNECVYVGQSTSRPCPGNHISVTGC